MKNKVTTHQNKEERIEKIELVSYRLNTGKGKGRIWERSYFEEIQVKFYQLFASVIRWSLENLRKKVYKNIVRLTRERKEGRKEGKKKSKSSWSLAVLRITNKRTNKTEKRPRGSNGLAERSLSFEFHANRSINKEMAADLVSCVQDNKQTNKQNSKRTPRFKRARRKKLKFRISCRSEHKQGNGSRFSENPWVKYASSCAVIGRKNKFAKRKETRFSRNRSTASEWAHR